ncbi:hypothetical protein [Catellatospora chokoriensis]|uniref:Transposase n=1 Tax=Catellatospora chokoriensis TaxID=310353 RepID=A0A8J3KEU8_9ACTN|nr:hypothetical protein [Catellatospora chokoriensis]GIF93774.1 hypothetical protein Cch02nite_72180 [Catellatospora chokoriensis]
MLDGRRPPAGQLPRPATAHTLLTASWHILDRQTTYHDLGADHFLNHVDPDRRRRRAIAQLEHLGYTVTINPATA